MYIKSFKVTNYKSFSNPTGVDLAQGFNVFTGKNNGGKTALLEALSLSFGHKAHVSASTKPAPLSLVDPISRVELVVSVTQEDLHRIILVRDSRTTFPVNPGISTEHWDDYLSKVLGLSNAEFELEVAGGGMTGMRRFADDEGLISGNVVGQVVAMLVVGSDRKARLEQAKPGNAPAFMEFDNNLFGALRASIFRFDAERFNMGDCAVGTSKVLQQNLANLAEVLQNIQHIPALEDEYNAAVREVLPQVYEVHSRPILNQKAEVVIYRTEFDLAHEHLAQKLSESGTGVGQVLGMLYVVISSREPRILLIDEPNSFLHPGAVRNLFDVFKRYPQHQYIVTTHSPTVISTADPATITIVQQKEAESDFVLVDPTSTDDLREALLDLGASLADVFGADNILWVEGPTEVRAFSLIMNRHHLGCLAGVAILPLRATGDLTGDQAEFVIEVYRRLSHGPSLMPPTVGIILDAEDRSAQKLVDLKKQCAELHFLSVRMFENYLLDPIAISELMNSYENFAEARLTPEDVEKWMSEHVNDKKYGPVPEGADGQWSVHVDAARLLEDMFSELSEARYEYDKVRDSVALTQLLLDLDTEALADIVDLLANVLQLNGRV